MCGRYTLEILLLGLEEWFDAHGVPGVDWLPRYNIAPSQRAPVVVQLASGAGRVIELKKWGLEPGWAKTPPPAQSSPTASKAAFNMINARAETAASKPAFRDALRRRRCIVPVSGFYEWRAGPHGKVPMRIRGKSLSILSLAGLWEGETFTILTRAANEFMSGIHDRMPVILPRTLEAQWLDPAITDPSRFQPLFTPTPGDDVDAEPLWAHAVSTLINSPRNDSAECITPVEDSSTGSAPRDALKLSNGPLFD